MTHYVVALRLLRDWVESTKCSSAYGLELLGDEGIGRSMNLSKRLLALNMAGSTRR